METSMRRSPWHNRKDLCFQVKKLKVCYLVKALTSLRAWYEKIDLYFRDQGFLQNDVDHKFYYTFKNGQLMILILYVDDLLLQEITWHKSSGSCLS